MPTLTQDAPRTYEVSYLDEFNDLPVAAAVTIFEGAAVGDNAAGFMRKLVALDPFMGFAVRKADNAAGAAGALNARLRERGKIVLDVAGVTGAGDVGDTVYASDDNTFTKTATANTTIGKIARFISGTKCVVFFESVNLRSL
jgi:hypothetical protein